MIPSFGGDQFGLGLGQALLDLVFFLLQVDRFFWPIRDLAEKYRTSSAYQQQVYERMRGSYGLHYRRMGWLWLIGMMHG